jgi:hypothetical protein
MGPWTKQRSRVHDRPVGSADNGHGSASPMHGTQALRGFGAHQQKLERKRAMR